MSEEETLTAKLTLLNDLILQDILLAKATALKIEIPANELDAAFTQAKGNITDEQFNQELTKRNVTAADMREGLRRELVTQKVIEREVQSKVTVSDQEVKAFFDANRDAVQLPRSGLSHRADRHHAGPRAAAVESHGRRRGDAGAGGAEGADADGAPQAGRQLRRNGARLLRRRGSRPRAAAISASCRCRS